jgi:hypothetical protein
MEKISINLLPIELREKSKKNTRKNRINQASIGVLVVVIIITLSVLSWTIVLKSSLQKANSDLATITQQVQAQKEKEGLVVLLKSRLDIINKLIQKESISTQSFNLISSLLPIDIKMLNLAVDKSGKIRMTASTTSLTSMQSFFNNLTDPKKNEGKITATKVESLNKTQDGNYNFELTISYSTK